MTDESRRRSSRRWKDMAAVEKYAFIQHHVLFLVLYVVAIYFVATRVGVGTAVFVFGGGIVITAVGIVVGIRRRRTRDR